MYYKLMDGFALRGWEKLPFALCETGKGKVEFLNKSEFLALSFCDGITDSESFLINPGIRKNMEEAVHKGFAAACRKGDTLRQEQKYHLYPCHYMEKVHWSITGKCNYRCRHCFMSAPTAKYGELDTGVILDIIDQMADCGITNINLTGGEPLIRADFLQIVDKLLEKKIRIRQIYSNGSLIDEELLDELERRGVICEFNISFDGVGWHDWLRGIDGAEKIAMDAFILLNKRGFPTGSEMCVHRNNIHTIEETVNLLSRTGVNNLKIIPVSDSGEWLKQAENKEYSLDLTEIYDAFLAYIPKYLEAGSPISLMLGGFFTCPKGTEEYSIPSAKYDGTKESCRQTLCGSARNTMYIAADGRLLPCMPLSGMDCQDEYPLITEIGLQKALSDSLYLERIDTRLEKLLKENARCRACDYKYVCGGGCRAGALLSSGNYLGCDESICKIFTGGYYDRISKFKHKKTGGS